MALSTPRTSGLSAICSCCRTPDTREGTPTPRKTHVKSIVTGSVTRLVPSTASWEKGYSRTSAAPTTIVSLMSRLIFPQEWKHLASSGHCCSARTQFAPFSPVLLGRLWTFGLLLAQFACFCPVSSCCLWFGSSFDIMTMYMFLSSCFVFFLDTMTDWINVDMSL